jgi:calpain
MTGGIQEVISLREMMTEKHKEVMWDILKKARILKTLMGASILAGVDERLQNGLVASNTYCITRVALLELNNRNLRLIRVFNTLGEWNGAWSDESKEWDEMNDDLKEALEYKNLPIGEFWMSFDDFYKNFHTIEFCNLIPPVESPEDQHWNLVSYHGEWVPGSTAGGCGQFNEALFWTNPQFLVTLTEPDLNDSLTTVLVSVLQKKTVGNDRFGLVVDEFIQFRFYRVKNFEDVEFAKNNGLRLYAGQLDRCGTSGKYINSREVTKRFRVEPGTYLIIPSCYDANRKGEFLIRLFTEKHVGEVDCKILNGHKDKLDYNDLFFFTKHDEELWGSCKSVEKSENEVEEKNSVHFKPVKTPIFETFEKNQILRF